MTICQKCHVRVAEKRVLDPTYRIYLWVCEECAKKLKFRQHRLPK